MSVPTVPGSYQTIGGSPDGISNPTPEDKHHLHVTKPTSMDTASGIEETLHYLVGYNEDDNRQMNQILGAKPKSYEEGTRARRPADSIMSEAEAQLDTYLQSIEMGDMTHADHTIAISPIMSDSDSVLFRDSATGIDYTGFCYAYKVADDDSAAIKTITSYRVPVTETEEAQINEYFDTRGTDDVSGEPKSKARENYERIAERLNEDVQHYLNRVAAEKADQLEDNKEKGDAED